MSVEKVERRDGPRYIVWWKDDLRRTKNKTFRRKADADAFDSKTKLAKRSGDLQSLDAGKETLREFHAEWVRHYAEPYLATKTRIEYDRYLKNDILPALGNKPLRRLTPLLIQEFATTLREDGRGDATVRKVLSVLQGILQRAVEWQRIPANPVKAVKKPSGKTKIRRVAHPPMTVEKLRRALPAMRDGLLVSLWAYAGLRPGESLALKWGDVGTQSISITKAVSLGEEKETKTGKDRVVPLLKPLAQDLNEWKLASGRPKDDALVFPASGGGHWKDHDFRNWRKRIFQPAATPLGIANPYELRHSYVSLRFAESANAAEIAEEVGNSLEVLLSTYTHVIAELRGTSTVSAEALILEARRGHKSVTWKDTSTEQGAMRS